MCAFVLLNKEHSSDRAQWEAGVQCVYHNLSWLEKKSHLKLLAMGHESGDKLKPASRPKQNIMVKDAKMLHKCEKFYVI